MAVLDPVVLGLAAAGIPRHAAGLAELGKPGPASGHDLVDVGLVAGVPEDDVAGGVEHPVDGQRQFDGAEVGSEVSARDSDGLDDEGPDLGGKLAELIVVESAKVGRAGDFLEHGCLRG